MSYHVPARWPAPGPALAGQGAAGGDQAEQHGAGRGAGAGQHLGHGPQAHQTRQVSTVHDSTVQYSTPGAWSSATSDQTSEGLPGGVSSV